MADSQSSPPASSSAALRRMKAARRRDTKPEIEVRRELHRRGLRYRVDLAPLVGVRRRADIVFLGPKVAVFIDGCFWHSCPLHATTPEANRDWWIAKLQKNVDRDRDTDRRLAEGGWRVVRAWEHEVPEEVADRIESLVRPHGSCVTPEPLL